MAHTLITGPGGLEFNSRPIKLDSSGDLILRQYSDSDEYFAAYCASLFIAKEYDSAAGSANYSQAGAITTSASSRTIGSFTDTFYEQPVGTHPGTSLSIGSTTTTLYRYLGYSHQYGLSDYKLSKDGATYPAEFDSDNFFYNNDGNSGHPIGRKVFRNDGTTFDQLCGIIGVDSSGDVWQMEGFENLLANENLDSSPKGDEHDDDPLYQLADRLIIKMATEEYPGTFRLDSVNSTLSADWVPYISNVFSNTTAGVDSDKFNIFIRKSFDFPSSAYGTSGNQFAMAIRCDSSANTNLESQWASTSTYPVTGLKELDSAQMKTTFGLLCLHRRWQLDNFGDMTHTRDAPYGLDGINTVGSYVLIDSAGPPPIYGTWAARGTAVDQRYTTQDQQHDHSYETDYTKAYTEQYQSSSLNNYETDYENEYLKEYVKDYLQDYEKVYSKLYAGFAGSQYVGPPVGFTNYAKQYAGFAPVNYEGTISLNYEGTTFNSPGYRQAYQGGYTSSTTVNYGGTTTVNYSGTTTVNYSGTTTVNYGGTTTVNYGGTTTVNYGGETTVNYGGTTTVNYGGTTTVNYEKVTSVNYTSSPAQFNRTYERAVFIEGLGLEFFPYVGQVTVPGGTYNKTTTNQYSGDVNVQYDRVYAGQYDRLYVGQYEKVYSGQYEKVYAGQYQKVYAGQYQKVYSGQYDRVYAGQYDRVFNSPEYTKQYNQHYVGLIAAQYGGFGNVQYEGTIPAQYEQQYSGTPVGFTTYSGTTPAQYQNDYARLYNKIYNFPYTKDYINLYSKIYDKLYLSQYSKDYLNVYGRLYTGQYNGETLTSNITTVNTYSLWQRVA